MLAGILAGCICPHPPLLIPAIGGKELSRVQKTVQAMRELAGKLSRLNPQVLVFISPHTPMISGAFTVKTHPLLRGDFSMFGHPEIAISKECDRELASAIIERGISLGLPIEEAGSRRHGARGLGGHGSAEELDHGILVPLYYIAERIDAPLISLSISFLPYDDHRILGRLVRECCRGLGRRAVFVASGDLSHRLIPGAPAGFSPRSEEFDRAICAIAQSGEFDRLDEIPEDLVEEAGECGLRSVYTMHGALKGENYSSELLSYEGPFGVGYLVSVHEVITRREGVEAGR